MNLRPEDKEERSLIMNLADIILLILLLAACAWAVSRIRKNRLSGNCCGGGGGCSACKTGCSACKTPCKKAKKDTPDGL